MHTRRSVAVTKFTNLALSCASQRLHDPHKADVFRSCEMVDGKGLLNQFIGDGSSFAKGAATGGLLGLLVGGKKTRKMAKTAATYGGVALVGGLAYKAWQNHKAGQQAQMQQPQMQPMLQQHASQQQLHQQPAPQALPMPPAGTGFIPQTPDAEETLARALLRAMVAAAKADGHIDSAEQTRIFERMGTMPLSNDDKAFVMDELRAPLDIDAVAAGASNPQEAAEIYAASLLAIDPDGPAEKGYLGMLGARLKLEPGLIAHLHDSVAVGAPLPGQTSVVA
ncbi:MAG: tellurite resistance TerB family protein [Rhodospirillaceae bacterium]